LRVKCLLLLLHTFVLHALARETRQTCCIAHFRAVLAQADTARKLRQPGDWPILAAAAQCFALTCDNALASISA
jgi:hypothetical protein